MADPEQRKHLIFGGLAILATLIVYLPSLANGFVWDDTMLILRNANVQTKPLSEVWFLRLWDASGVSMGSINPLYADVYRPWITFCYAVTYRLFGPEPFAFHLVSVCVHLANTALAYAWLRSRYRSSHPVALSFAVLLFAIHPSKVESVAWISGSTDVWMGFFVLSALYTRERASGNSRTLLLATCSLLAMFSKETSIALLGWMLTDDYLHGRLRQNLRDYLAFIAGVVVVFIFRSVAVDSSNATLLERFVSDVHGLSGVASTYGHYLRQTFVFFDPAIQPSYLHYKPGQVPVLDTWSVVVGALFLSGVLMLAIRNLKTPPLFKHFFLAAWLYFLFFLPVSNLIQLGTESLTADRFLYVPLLGVSIWVVGLLKQLASARIKTRSFQSVAALVAAGILIACGVSAVSHTQTFTDNRALLTSSLGRDPKNMYALALLSDHQSGDEARKTLLRGHQQAIKEGRYSMALRFALRAMKSLASETADRDQQTLQELLIGFQQLETEGRLRFAHSSMKLDAHLSRTLHRELLAQAEDFLHPYAGIAARTGHFKKAESLLERAVDLAPNDAQLRADLAIVRAKLGRWAEADKALNAAEKRLPGEERIARARKTLERAKALNAALPTMTEMERKLAEIFVPLAVADLRSARIQYLDLWAEIGALPPVVDAAVQVELADGLPGHARQLLERARSERPDLEPHWLRIESELQSVSGLESRKVW